MIAFFQLSSLVCLVCLACLDRPGFVHAHTYVSSRPVSSGRYAECKVPSPLMIPVLSATSPQSPRTFHAAAVTLISQATVSRNQPRIKSAARQIARWPSTMTAYMTACGLKFVNLSHRHSCHSCHSCHVYDIFRRRFYLGILTYRFQYVLLGVYLGGHIDSSCRGGRFKECLITNAFQVCSSMHN
ncbi:hypothetical protein GGR50DRAFT_679455 [Xylaria sp. CBS 124048]|nr:hypothetical protein GGR50DRAFT_679455 [Xylaria sp. CBS 124048]